MSRLLSGTADHGRPHGMTSGPGPPRLPHSAVRGLPRWERSDRVLPGVSAVSSKKARRSQLELSIFPRAQLPHLLQSQCHGVEGPDSSSTWTGVPLPPSPPQAPPVDAGCPPLPYPYAEPNARCYPNGRRCGKPVDRSARLNNGARPEKANARYDLKWRADASRAEHETPSDRKKHPREERPCATKWKRALTLFATEKHSAPTVTTSLYV
jgi:hypothetical protein